MDILKKYQVVFTTSGAILKEFEKKESARKYINSLLRNIYNAFLENEEKTGGGFVDYWRWYYLHKTGKKRNCKLYTIKTIKI